MLKIFDIPCDVPGRSWSPNGLKIIISAGIKGIPYEIEWVEYPDIERTLKKHNIPPTAKRTDGSDEYTLPAILDIDNSTGNVKAAMAESAHIARYFDEAYPDFGPKLFPGESTEGSQVAYDEVTRGDFSALLKSFDPLRVLMVMSTYPRLHDVAKAHFTKSKADEFYDMFQKQTLEEIAVVLTENRVAAMWAETERSFDRLDKKYAETYALGEWYFGNRVSLADAAVGALLLWIREIEGEESKKWKDVQQWNQGRWARMIQCLKGCGAPI